jgi:glucokinase
LDRNPESVGLVIPGEVNSQGICYRLTNIAGFENVNIASILSPLLDCPVVVENDGNAAALGEALYGRGQHHKSFAMLTLGTGIGGGIVIDGRVRTGAYGFAAETGHVPVDNRDDAWTCGCGQKGCVEAYAGTFGLLRKFRELGGVATEVRTIAESARNGERAGVATFEMMSSALARCVLAIQHLLDLDAIVFSGGISQSFDLIEPNLRAEVRRQAFSKPLGEVPLLVSELGPRAGVIGSANLHLLDRR